MKLSEILLFITILFLGWFGLEKQKQCERKDELIIKQNARIEFYERYPLCSCAKLEFEYNELVKRNIPKKYGKEIK